MNYKKLTNGFVRGRVKDSGDMFSENIKKQYNDAKLAFESVFNEDSLNPKGYSDLKLEIEQNYTYKIYEFNHPDISSIINAYHSCGSQRIDSLVMDIYETALDYVLSENKGISNEEADSLAWDLIVNDYGYYIQYKTVLGIAQDHGSGVIEIEFYINLESRDGRSAHRQKVLWKVLGLDYLTGIKRNAQEIVDKINSINFSSEKIEYGSSRNVSDSRRVKDSTYDENAYNENEVVGEEIRKWAQAEQPSYEELTEFMKSYGYEYIFKYTKGSRTFEFWSMNFEDGGWGLTLYCKNGNVISVISEDYDDFMDYA